MNVSHSQLLWEVFHILDFYLAIHTRKNESKIHNDWTIYKKYDIIIIPIKLKKEKPILISVVICDANVERAKELETLINEYLKTQDDAPASIKIVTKTRSKIMLVPTAAGEELIYIRNLNYINIEERSLCYHLTDGILKASHVLRNSFEKSIRQYLHNDNLMFIKPSLLINLANIKSMDKDKLTFRNGEVLYYPKKYYEDIRARWIG